MNGKTEMGPPTPQEFADAQARLDVRGLLDSDQDIAPHLARAELEHTVLLVLDAYRPWWVPARLWPRSRVAAAIVDHLHVLGALPVSGEYGDSDAPDRGETP